MQAAARATVCYWGALSQWVFTDKGYSDVSYFKDDLHAQVQVYSLSLIFSLWHEKHYRCQSFQQDMLDNLRNVALPGTGIPLSLFCYSWWLCLAFVLFANPLVCLLGAVNRVRKAGGEGGLTAVCMHYTEHLLHPLDWFSLWRLNCRLVSLHSLLLRPKGYTLEDKWAFLKHGKEVGVPVSPYSSEPRSLVVKNKNIEGGMGIYFYENAVHGGNWILQDRLENAPWLDELLPTPAPLSTMRVITSSCWTLSKHAHDGEFEAVEYGLPTDAYYPDVDSAASGPGDITDDKKGKNKNKNNQNSKKKGGKAKYKEGHSLETAQKYVKPLSAVLRLGRAKATTDHTSVLFDVDTETGKVKAGRSNSHWYELGIDKVLRCSWLPQGDGFTCHPDTPDKPPVTGYNIPDMQAALDIVVQSHYNMLADVPMVGWDVAFCKNGIYLLEVNLSCNFFMGTFDVPAYLHFVDDQFCDLEARAAAAAASDGAKKEKKE